MLASLQGLVFVLCLRKSPFPPPPFPTNYFVRQESANLLLELECEGSGVMGALSFVSKCRIPESL